SPLSFGGLAGIMISQSEIVPGMRVVGQKRGRGLQFLERLRIFATLDESFTIKQGTRPGRSTTGDEQYRGKQECERSADFPVRSSVDYRTAQEICPRRVLESCCGLESPRSAALLPVSLG